MSFNLTEFAKKYKYRTRNFHDGYPVPPYRTHKQKRRSKGYSSKNDRNDCIICTYGFVDQYSPDCAGWFLAMKAGMTRRLQAIQNAGGVVLQLGDKEAAGYVPVKHLPNVLKVLKPKRKRSKKRS